MSARSFAKLTIVSLVIMGIGLVTYLTTPLWSQFGLDTDILGFATLLAGIAIFVIGFVRRKKLSGLRLAAIILLTAVLSFPVLFLIAGLIFYWITGRELGW